MNRKNSLSILLFAFLIVIICSTILPVLSLQCNIDISSHGTINYSSSPPPTPPPSQGLPMLHVDGTHLKDASGNIVILRGVNYDSGRFYDEGHWDGKQMGYIKAMGCNCVWIGAFWWDMPDIYVDAGFWAVLDSMMSSAYSNNLYVVFRGFAMSGHSIGSCGFSTSSWLSEWDTISSRYSSYTNIIYEPISEYLHWTYSQYQTNIRSAIDTIRSNSPNAVISVQACGTGDGNWPATFNFEKSNPISRSNIIFSFDPYGYFTSSNSQSAIRGMMDDLGASWILDNGRCLISSEFGGDEAYFNSWSQTWVQNFMAVFDSDGASGYGAWRWATVSEEDCWNLLADWNGNLSAYGKVIQTYYLAH